jgi:hypothetical protein
MIRKCTGFTCIIFIIFSGCFCRRNDPTHNEAQDAVMRLLQAIDKNDLKEIEQLYSFSFFDKVSFKQWYHDLQKIKSIVGDYKSLRLLEYSEEAKNFNEKRIVLLYEIIYSKKLTKQTFTLQEENNIFKIFGHNIKIE